MNQPVCIHGSIKVALSQVFGMKKAEKLNLSWVKRMKNILCCCFNVITFMAISAVNSQLIPYLNYLEITPSLKSWILGGSALISLIFAVGVGYLSDRLKKFKPSFYITLSLFMISVLGSFLLGFGWLQIVLIVVMFALVKEIMSINETWIFSIEPQKFGKFHCFSALGLVIGSLLAGWIHQQISAVALCIFILICSLISGLLAFKIEDKTQSKGDLSFSKMKQLLVNKDYMLLIFILFLLMLSGFADQFVVVDKLIALGGSKVMVSVKFAIQSLMEIPIYLASLKLFKRFESVHLLLLASIMTGVKFLSYGFSSTIFWLLASSTLQLLTHPLIVLTAKMLIAKTMDKSLASSSQIIGFAIYFGLSGFITPVVSNWLAGLYSVEIVLFIFAALAILPTYLIWKNRQRYMMKR